MAKLQSQQEGRTSWLREGDKYPRSQGLKEPRSRQESLSYTGTQGKMVQWKWRDRVETVCALDSKFHLHPWKNLSRPHAETSGERNQPELNWLSRVGQGGLSMGRGCHLLDKRTLVTNSVVKELSLTGTSKAVPTLSFSWPSCNGDPQDQVHSCSFHLPVLYSPVPLGGTHPSDVAQRDSYLQGSVLSSDRHVFASDTESSPCSDNPPLQRSLGRKPSCTISGLCDV